MHLIYITAFLQKFKEAYMEIVLYVIPTAGYARRKWLAKITPRIYKAKRGFEPVGSTNILITRSHWLSHDLFNHLYILQYKLQLLY